MYEVMLWFTVLSICSLTTVLLLCIGRRIKIKSNPAYVLHSIPTKVNISYDKHIPRHRDQVELKSPQVPLDCDGIQHPEIHQVCTRISTGSLQPQRINDTVQYQEEVIVSNGTGRFELVHAEVMTQSILENEEYDYAYAQIQHNPFPLHSKTESDSKSETAKYQNVFVTSQITGSDAIPQSKQSIGTKKVLHSYENLVLQNSKDELNPAGMCNESQITGSDAIPRSKRNIETKKGGNYENLVLQNSKDELNPVGMCNESQITGSDAIPRSKRNSGTKMVFQSYENLVLQNSKDELNPAGMCNESTSPETQPPDKTQPQNCPDSVILNSEAQVSQLLPWVLYQQDINKELNVVKYFSLV